MNYKKLIQVLGFSPKENTSDIFQKKYSGYVIEINFEKETINFGNKIKGESKTTQNFSQTENWVVLECVDRLLEKGYRPQNITLEKTWKTGHGTSGRLDILVTRDSGSAYIMIECKTWGAEFDQEFKNLEKNGGQLFTYFQQDKDADVLMLYASGLDGPNIKYRNEIIKIEEDYRQAGNVKDFFERWNKLPKANGIFDNWVSPYEFQSKALTKNDLKTLKQEDSSFIFNRFLEILRHNVVSDKPNAFNKIFTLFLCKIVDENRNPDEQLHFQWLEGEDNHISFQKRLTDLYNRGMLELLEKKVTDVSDIEFDKQFLQVEEKYKDRFKEILTEIRLKKNNEFAIKEVYDDASFEENAKVVKEVVELLQVYQLRYNYRQQFLSDFFELLLTTGLKQESGQFFTPVPIARFIIKSLPFLEITAKKIEQGNKNDLLPRVIDYAAGSGHFITESMEEIQKYIDSLDEGKFNPATKRAVKKWKEDQFDWAEQYVYGIEKDYRLVKTAKVSCYLHGDGLAKVIHGDGLGDFATSAEFKDLLKETDRTYPQDNKQFDVIISNPPYSVSAFKGLMDSEKSEKAFDLYKRLTDQSSEIECLFIERTKQLLKDGGVAGIILPSSILSNTGIYTQTREILLKYFEILGITELGSNTFMATGTNTVTLFLRRRNNVDAFNIEEAIKKCFINLKDVTINGIEKPINKYIAHVWGSISYEDYKTLLQKIPNKNIEQHEIYKEYVKKIKANNEQELWSSILALEQDKLLYFILAYPQKLVLVKTGEKDAEKRFLGYEFSNRRGSEGIHAIQRSKSIDECTQLYDADSFTNSGKASTYIYKAFNNEFDLDLPENLQQNVSYHNLVDKLIFDRVDFEKSISLSAKKKVKFEEVWKTAKLEFLSDIADIQKGKTITEEKAVKGNIPVIAGGQSFSYYHNKSNREGNIITVSASGAYAGFINYFDIPIFASDCNTVKSKNEKNISTKLIFHFLKSIQREIYQLQRGQAQPHVYADDLSNVKIPLPSFSIQKKIVSEIEKLEKQEQESVENLEKLRQSIGKIISKSSGKLTKLEEITSKIGSGATPNGGKGNYQNSGISLIRSQNIYDNVFVEKGLAFINEEQAKKLDNVIVERSDILFNITGASIARCCIVDEKYLPARVNQHVSIIRTNEKALPKYVQAILVSYEYKTKLLEIGDGATSREAITKLQLEEFKIPLPTIPEQKRIVSEIVKIEKKITELEKQIDLIPKQQEAILKKYLV
ncbi:restriction endonuclease subunit S [Leptospira alexanderi]|uniref:N-6 DNA Methylase n=1 Tax=Leptospira alexanderi serovar Manhao 3 str. L 60 TaxID=1049759 RepID=V6HUC0_9LEPT|nr:restriction endonuclease subunit S [Leptospira alexanderi]EQA60856.1 N-6 DNA Methylase [Leptospira alexanderi serovar Manhao 3 str. L 60]